MKMTNKEIERKAIAVVMEYEGPKRKPAEIKQGKGYDISSNGRFIEVKGTGKKKLGFVTFQPGCHRALEKKRRYFVYVVTNLKAGRPELYVINRNNIKEHLKRKTTWEIRLPVKEMQKWKRHLNHDKNRGRKSGKD
jgi:hypothetical protein